MHASSSMEEYCNAPLGSYFAVPSGLVFCASAQLWGFALWGCPARQDIELVVSLVACELQPQVKPHRTLVDLRSLEVGDPDAFAPLARHARSHTDVTRAKIQRAAVVRPRGVLGMTVAGFPQVIAVPYPVRVVDDVASAIAWLGARRLRDELSGLIQRCSGNSPVLAQLRRWLERHLGEATLAGAARALARSERSLQRDLHNVGSSFVTELLRARIQVGKRLLLETDASLTEIAYVIGCASPQHFSAMFRHVVGEAPSRWRTTRWRTTRSQAGAGL